MIEPCCAERQVCWLLREERGHAVMMQTNGDVTLTHWMQAVMLLSGDRPRTLTIAVPQLTEAMQRTVCKYMRLEWVAKLRLMTRESIPTIHLPERKGSLSEELMQFIRDGRVELAYDQQAQLGMLMFEGTDGTVVIQGEMLEAVSPGLRQYSGTFGRTGGRAVTEATEAFEALFRRRRVSLSPNPSLEGKGEKPTPDPSLKGRGKKSKSKKEIIVNR